MGITNHNSPLLSTFLRYVSRSPWNFREPLAESWLKLSIRSIELWFSTESTARATACLILWSRKDPARLCFGLRSARKVGCQTSHQVIVKGNSKSLILIFRHFFGGQSLRLDHTTSWKNGMTWPMPISFSSHSMSHMANYDDYINDIGWFTNPDPKFAPQHPTWFHQRGTLDTLARPFWREPNCSSSGGRAVPSNKRRRRDLYLPVQSIWMQQCNVKERML